MNPRATGRHKAAASIAQGYDPGSYLRTGTAKPGKRRRKHRRGKKRWTARKQLLIEKLKEMPFRERMEALRDIQDKQILRACGIRYPSLWKSSSISSVRKSNVVA